MLAVPVIDIVFIPVSEVLDVVESLNLFSPFELHIKKVSVVLKVVAPKDTDVSN